MKEEVLIRLLRRNSSKKIFEEKIENFKISHLRGKGYPEDLINSTLKEVTFEDRKLALPQKKKEQPTNLAFVTQYTNHQCLTKSKFS